MEEMVLKVTDKKKVVFLKKLLSQFDFVEIEKKKREKNSGHSIFNSAGLWEKRKINELNLRETAWKRGE
ncbi:MAG TPA: hypothetical protein P5210_10080 [Draconibacterium sp.]|jgi:hypothetical protein|nr:hypothetical protein [Draconibacterium sp.]HRX11986.1 hypothetical protein [Draconibacterium sp.]